MTTTNIIDVTFGSEKKARTEALFQYDYGQILNFTDLELPEEFEIDFAYDISAVTTKSLSRLNILKSAEASMLSSSFTQAKKTAKLNTSYISPSKPDQSVLTRHRQRHSGHGLTN